MLGQYFYHESIRKTIVAFGSLFNDVFIIRKNAADKEVQTLKVPLAYGPKQKFLVRLVGDPNLDQKVAITLPRIGFELTGIDYDPTRKLNRIIKQKKVANTTTGKTMNIQYAPVPYNLSFEMFVMTKNSDDGIQIVEQILPFFQPEYTVSIKEVPEMDIVRDVPIILNNISYEDTYEGDFQTRRAIVYTFSFSAKCYVYGPVSTQLPVLKADVKSYADVTKATAERVQQYTISVTGAQEGDDNFGFNEYTSEWIDAET